MAPSKVKPVKVKEKKENGEQSLSPFPSHGHAPWLPSQNCCGPGETLVSETVFGTYII